jgi:hypothetical protein
MTKLDKYRSEMNQKNLRKSKFNKKGEPMFPDCIGKYVGEDCEKSTPELPGPDCKRCPYFK